MTNANNPFRYVLPTDDQKAVMEELRAEYNALYQGIMRRVPNGRGRQLAITHLEESAMWLNKGITENDRAGRN